MREKERYSYDYFIDGAVFIDTENDRDMDMDTVCSLLNKQDKQIADLEAKLAESERKNFELLTKLNLKEYAPAFCTLADRDCEALGQIEELKNQLEEKEKEIEKLSEWLSQYEANRKFKQEKKNLVTKNITEMNEQLKTQPGEIGEKIKKEIEKDKD